MALSSNYISDLSQSHDTHEMVVYQSLLQHFGDLSYELFQFLTQSLDKLNLDFEDLLQIDELSPYLILDGHRTGIADHEENPARGYAEGAMFSLRFAAIMKKMGGKQATFLIHTLRNYQTMDRMRAIFDAVSGIADKFICEAKKQDIKLQYFGHEVHNPDQYVLGQSIVDAEMLTKDCEAFKLNFLTNYSQDWGTEHLDELEDLPEISVIGRFTKGHYSGAGIPRVANKANFVYIQQASVNENWTDQEMILLILSLLKSHIALNGFVGGKKYQNGEREAIRVQRELELYEEDCLLSKNPKKQIISFSPKGPMYIKF